MIHLARMGAHRYDSMKRFCIAWEDLHQPNLFQELYPELTFTEPTLEQCCDLAKIPYEDFVGDIHRLIYWYGIEMSKEKLRMRIPEIVNASINEAIYSGPKGFQDRQLLLQATDIAPKGPGVIINNNNQIDQSTKVIGLPNWADSDKLVMETLSQKALPESSIIDLETVEVTEAIDEHEQERSPRK